MKVAIFGASGLVGRSLRILLDQSNIPWVGTYNTSPFEGGIHLKFTDVVSLQNLLEEHAITHCVNCVAERNVDRCEKQQESTMETNCWFAKRLAESCLQKKVYFLHVSTDYVFDGSASPYYPDSKCFPIQAYGKSKLQAEVEIQQIIKEACIVRVPVLYTQRYTTILETAVTMIGKKVMDTTRSYTEDNYYIRRPVFIDDMSVFLLSCMQKEQKGTVHFYNSSDKTTKYQIALEIAQYLGKSASHIQAQGLSNYQAGRPYDTHLLDINYDRKLYPDTRLIQGIAKCFERLYHPPLVWKEAPSSPIFFMLDLDGTLVDTEHLHYNAYKNAFEKYGFSFLNWDEYQQLSSLETYCKETLGGSYDEVKRSKQEFLYQEDIQFLPGAEALLHWLLNYNQNFVIVTNTGKETVDFYKSQLPLLQKVTQWITREDVTYPKPDPEPYRTAKECYWKGESYCVGFENTVAGYLSLSETSSINYIICNSDSYTHRALMNKDVYFVVDLCTLFRNIGTL